MSPRWCEKPLLQDWEFKVGPGVDFEACRLESPCNAIFLYVLYDWTAKLSKAYFTYCCKFNLWYLKKKYSKFIIQLLRASRC